MSDYQVNNPATGEVEATYPTATEQDIQNAIEQAHSAYQDWRQVSLTERSALLHKIADIYLERQDELARIVANEMGKPVAQAKGEIGLVAEIYRYYADNAEQLLAPHSIDVDSGSASVEKLPVGALLGIMPWNYPHYQVARFAAPNFMAGNTIILKHAPQCPKTAEAIVDILKEAGLPEGVYNNVFATNEQAATIIEDSRVQGVSLTGSERAGQAVAKVAGGALKKVVLELGGSDAFIVAADADIEQAVKGAIEGRFGNTGQACNAAKRLIVVESVYDKFVEGFTNAVRNMTLADPLDEGTFIGPMSSKAAAVNLQEQLDSAVQAGATVLVEHSEILDKGEFCNTNLRSAPCLVTYVLKGDGQEEGVGDENPLGPVYLLVGEEFQGHAAQAWPIFRGKEVEKRQAAFNRIPLFRGYRLTVGGALATPAAESGKHGRQAGVVSVEYAEMYGCTGLAIKIKLSLPGL